VRPSKASRTADSVLPAPLRAFPLAFALALMGFFATAATRAQQTPQASPPQQPQSAASAQHSADYLAKRAIIAKMLKEGQGVQALPLAEALVKENPDDPLLLELYGTALIAKAASLPKGEERTQTRLHVREVLLRAQSLGNHSNFVAVILEQIPADGSEPGYSNRKDADDVMHAAEAAFARGNYDEAIAGYQHALELDPQNYDAALFIGDSYYKKKDYENAGVWFAKAVAIDPDKETAYRYWGDALSAAGDQSAAREKFIEAVVAAPYQKTSWVGLTQWAGRVKVTLSHPRIESPNSLQTKPEGGANITINAASLDTKDGSSAWLVYEMTRVLWKNSKFREQFPDEPAYRHSLAEEADAYGAVAASASAQLDGKTLKPKDLNPQLATLLKLKEEGLLEPYVLLAHADAGIASDYPAYYKAHRDKLIEYMNEYVVPPAKD
jgi:tetratricopeptide (TPR) repeat protein